MNRAQTLLTIRHHHDAYDDTWLTPEQAALALNVAVTTLAWWRRRKSGPVYHKAGKLIRYPRHAIAEFRELTRVEPQRG
jgi:Helix-turn-helix domain